MDTFRDCVLFKLFFLSMAKWSQKYFICVSESQDFIKTFQKNWKIKLDFWVLSCFSWTFLLIFLNKTLLEFVCFMENAYHFLINSSYNSYGFGPRSLRTFWRQRARKVLAVSLKLVKTFALGRLVTSVYCSSKPSIYYYYFTTSMQTTY